MEEITSPKISTISQDNNSAVIEIEPLAPGFGYTIGNSLRRVMLSCLFGSAITEVKIEGVTHEFTSIQNVKEDILEMILNIKDIKVKKLTDEPVTLKLDAKSTGVIKASDITKNANVEIINQDKIIATLDKGGQLSMEMTVENGRGFSPTDDREKSGNYGAIALDAVFTPVEVVDYHVENTRVGQMTNYDKLILDIKTTGIITPKEALDQAIKVLLDQFGALSGEPVKEKVTKIEEESIELEEDTDEVDKVDLDSKTRINELSLSSRTVNALTNAGIKTVGGLKRLSELKLSEIKGLGNKGFEEIRELLS